MDQITFKIDTRLLKQLSQKYASTELALKELVDNAWDADATSVSISLPEVMTNEPINIEDNGKGMNKDEIEGEYLNIASNRRQRHGDFTLIKKRKVKGSKGIGKFAGFMAGTTMKFETWAMGVRHEFQLDISVLEHHLGLHEIPISLLSIEDHSKQSGTRITLTNLFRHLNHPNPNRFRQLLILEYGREMDFLLSINDKVLDIDDIQGNFLEKECNIPEVGKVKLRFTISDQKTSLRTNGIIMRVGGKIVGEPSFFGLDKSEDFPQKLLKKCFGEIEVDGLFDDVGAIFENSEKYSMVEQVIQPILREEFKKVYGQEIHLSQARLKKKIEQRLGLFPEFKKIYADRAIKKVLEKYYQEPESKIEPLVNVLLDAIESTDYRIVLEHINDAKNSDVTKLAEALDEFGLLEIMAVHEQTKSRLKFLDNLEILCNNPDTLEKDVHIAIENNLWVLGASYSLFSSNKTLKYQVKTMLDREYSGSNGDLRPDLMLSEDLNGYYLLIEFKRPKHILCAKDYDQVVRYRREFFKNTAKKKISVLLIGGRKKDDVLHPDYQERDVSVHLFKDIISTARRQLEWILKGQLQSQKELCIDC